MRHPIRSIGYGAALFGLLAAHTLAAPVRASALNRTAERCLAGLRRIERQMAEVTASAEAAAEIHARTNGTVPLRLLGEPLAGSEFGGRVGGLDGVVAPLTPMAPDDVGLVLVFLSDDSLLETQRQLESIQPGQAVVIAFGPGDLIDDCRRKALRLDYAFSLGDGENLAGTPDRKAEEWVIQMAAGWTWMGEFVAACRRRGDQPDIITAPGERTVGAPSWNRGTRPANLRPIRRGVLGRQYLRELRKRLNRLATEEAEGLRSAALQAARASAAPGLVRVLSDEKGMSAPVFDLGLGATLLPVSAAEAGGPRSLGRGDVAVLVDANPPESILSEWHRRGASLIWLTSWRGAGRNRPISIEDILIDQAWPSDDTCLIRSGVEVPLAPAGRILIMATMAMMTDEIRSLADSWTPPVPYLHAAIGDRDRTRVSYLVEAGVGINDRDVLDRTPLMMAAAMGEEETVRRLLRAGADARAADAYGVTAMHMAAAQEKPEIVRLLIAAAGPIHARDRFGRTPLHVAAEQGRREVAEALIEGGASPRARNRFLETPWDTAQRMNRGSVIEIPTKAGIPVAPDDARRRTPWHGGGDR